MKESNIERLLRLTQKTGDTLVVSPEKGDPVVIMPVERYEALFTEDIVDFRPVPKQEVSQAVDVVREEDPEVVEIPVVNQEIAAEDEIQTEKIAETSGEERFYLEPVE